MIFNGKKIILPLLALSESCLFAIAASKEGTDETTQKHLRVENEVSTNAYTIVIRDGHNIHHEIGKKQRTDRPGGAVTCIFILFSGAQYLN
jgi:hypothetical protein